MQVTQTEDSITHAVIGGTAAIGFKVAESNFLMHMLSSTLYQRPKEAVVRETTCNAWDSHIASGRTDTPIEITLTPTKLTIKDFGLGIPKDKIGDIYGTYGASTKTNDGKQTGGFGLGSKSPFAVGEHFQVISACNGEKTIYAMSKSSAEVNGTPSIIPVASFPTKESGVTVTIDISERDVAEYEALIHMVIRNGDILCNYNGKLIDSTLSFKNQSNNWLIVSRRLSWDRHSRETRINVRYGNVIYPVENHTKYGVEYSQISRWLDRAMDGRGATTYKLVLQAKPDSLSVMPSREGLSMQDHTVNSLTKLLKEFVPVMSLYSEPLAYKILEDGMKQIIAEKNFNYLISNDHTMPQRVFENVEQQERIKVIRDIEGITTRTLSVSYPDSAAFYQRHTELRRAGAIEVKPERKELLLSLFAEIDRVEKGIKLNRAQSSTLDKRRYSRRGFQVHGRQSTAWWKRNILHPVVQGIRKHPHMKTENLFVFKKYGGEKDIVEHRKFAVDDMDHNFKHMRKYVCIYFSKVSLTERMSMFPIWSENGERQDRDGTLLYHAHDSRKNIDSIRQFFVDQGYTILDLTIRQPWESEPAPKVGKELYGPPAPPKKRPTVHVALKHVYRPGYGYRVDHAFHPELTDPLRVANPDCYVRIETSKMENRPFNLGFDDAASKVIVKWLGERCVVVRNDTDENKLKEAGVPALREFVFNHVVKVVSTEPRFLNHWTDDFHRNMGERVGAYVQDGELVKVGHLFDNPEIRETFGLVNYLSNDDMVIMELWRLIQRESYRHDDKDEFIAATKIIRNLPLNPHVRSMVRELRTNEFVGLLLGSKLERMLSTDAARVIKMLEVAITE